MYNFLEIKSVSKHFNQITALDRITTQIPSGKIFTLLGPNGAGKTTLLRIITDIIKPDEGNLVFNNPLHKNKISYLPEEKGLFSDMNIIEEVVFFARMKGIKKNSALEKFKFWSERFNLDFHKKQKVKELSKGNTQKLLIIICLISNPELLILDEPFTGLDAVSINVLEQVLSDMKKKQNTTIILSSHLMDQAERLSDQVCLINKGKIVLDDSLENIRQNTKTHILNLKYTGKLDLDQISPQNIVLHTPPLLDLKITTDKLNEIIKFIVDQVEVQELNVRVPSLREIFLEQVGNG